MTPYTVTRATAAHYSDIVRRLRRAPGRHALALQDLQVWPERSDFWSWEPSPGPSRASGSTTAPAPRRK